MNKYNIIIVILVVSLLVGIVYAETLNRSVSLTSEQITALNKAKIVKPILTEIKCSDTLCWANLQDYQYYQEEFCEKEICKNVSVPYLVFDSRVSIKRGTLTDAEIQTKMTKAVERRLSDIANGLISRDTIVTNKGGEGNITLIAK
jgi:Na+-transporting NADH:ubiquinone oxidoreductase subunit NqrC